MLAFLFIGVNYLEGPPFLLLQSATWKGWHLFFMDVRILGWKAGFFLHCCQLPGGADFSLIDVSYLQGLAFIFIDVSYLAGLAFLFQFPQ